MHDARSTCLFTVILTKPWDDMTDSGFVVAAGLLVYVAFAVLQCVVLQPEPYYSVYDSDNWAKACWFLLKRLGLAPGQSRRFTSGADFSIFNSTAISNVPGGYNRWRLPQDTSGKCYSIPLLDVALFQTVMVTPVWKSDVCYIRHVVVTRVCYMQNPSQML